MNEQPFRLKKLTDGSEYPLDQCAAMRCNAQPDVDDDSRAIWKIRVPLCQSHWEKRSEIELPVSVVDTAKND